MKQRKKGVFKGEHLWDCSQVFQNMTTMLLKQPTESHFSQHKQQEVHYGSTVEEAKLHFLQYRPHLQRTQKGNECTFQRFPKSAKNGDVAMLN
jgi:hypothetical protein